MTLTVLSMLSTTSLQAFSGATTTAPLQRAAPAAPAARLVREQAAASRPATAAPLPNVRPSLPPPRGSFLNLSV